MGYYNKAKRKILLPHFFSQIIDLIYYFIHVDFIKRHYLKKMVIENK